MTGPEAERLHLIHEQMTTDPMLVRSLVTDITGDTEAPIERITVGETNEVYAVGTPEGRILRINHETGDNFAREQWALERARDKGVPVPTVLEMGTFQAPGGTRYYEMQGLLPGKPFADLIDEGMPEPDRRIVAAETGKFLTAIHEITTTGFGDLGASGRGEHSTMQAWFAAIAGKEAALRQVFAAHAIDPALCGRAFALLEQSSHLFKGASPHLVHDDLAPKHVLVSYEGDRPFVSGIIDLELVKSGYLGHEIPEWQLRHAASVPFKWVMEGYRRQQSPADVERTRITALHKYLVLLDYYALEAPSEPLTVTCLDGIRQLTEQ